MSEEDRAAIEALPFNRQHFGKEAYIVREGQAVAECALLLSGFAFRQKLLRSGSRQIISFHVAGEFVDLQNSLLKVADHNVQSLSRTEVARIPIPAVIALSDERPAVRRAMWSDTLVDASIFREWVVNVGRRDSRTRIAHLLCELALRLTHAGLHNGNTFDLPVTQEQLADATGQTAVHTNRTLQSLRRDRLIQLDAGSLRILDWAGLRAAGDFDELYLHHSAN